MLLVSSLMLTSARGDFTPPKDGKLTEKQVTSFIEITKDQMDTLKSAGKAAQGVGGVGAVAIAEHAGEKMDASIASHGMTKEEYNWVSEQVTKLWPIALYQKQWDDTGKPDLEKQIKARQADEDAAKAKLATYQKAQKDGQRVMTKEQRDAAIASATSDRNAASDDLKSATDALKPINDEIAQHDKDAADAEALAKNPPADVSADDRNNYIDARKNDAQTAKDAAKDARDRLKDAQKAVDDAKARVTAAGNRVDHPEVPVSDDDKASVKQENDQAVTDATKQIADDEDAIKTLKETLAAGPMDLTAGSKDKPDPDNLALVKKHVGEYMDAIGANDKK
jgi:hypothetical protein